MTRRTLAGPLVATLVGLVVAPLSMAGDFRVQCSYKHDNLKACANVVSDLVTDKFIAAFPATDFTIFVHSDIHAYSEGGYVAYAVAGVSPYGSSQFPIQRYSATTMERSKRADKLRLAEVERENFRDVVKQLMDECEISPTCEVYIPRTPRKP